MKKSNGAGPRRKGDTFERECVNYLLENFILAERVPLSGAAGGSFNADVEVLLGGIKRKFECKRRQRAWKELYDWLDGNFALFIRRDRDKPLVVMRLEDFAKLHADPI